MAIIIYYNYKQNYVEKDDEDLDIEHTQLLDRNIGYSL